MSNLSKTERDRLPDCDFADPEHRTMVVLDDEDVRRAAIRTNNLENPLPARLRIIEIAQRKNLGLTPALALISLAEKTVAEGMVPPAQGDALRFNVSSEAEINNACALAKQLLKEKSMSTNFQNRHDSPEGRRVLQEVHDIVARFGAICTAPGKLSADFVSKHESNKIQAIHNLAAEGGAKCRAVGDNIFSHGDESGLADPRELAREHVKARNEKRPVVGRATGEVPESTKTHIAKRNAQIAAQRERKEKVEKEGGIVWG